MEAAEVMVLQDLYDQLTTKRDIKFEVLINSAAKCRTDGLCMNYKAES